MDLYLQLSHGRTNPEEEMKDWGDLGPDIGPLKFVHSVYATEIHLEFAPGVSEAQIVKFGFNPMDTTLCYVGDLLIHQGVYYGDYTVFCATPEEIRSKILDEMCT